MKGQALKPDFFLKNIPSLLRDQEAEKKGATDEERDLYAMSQTRGWQIFNEFSSRVVSELDSVNKLAISQGASLEEIGRNAIVINLSQDVISKLLNKVADAIEACEQNGK